jgi:hypothetical protein
VSAGNGGDEIADWMLFLAAQSDLYMQVAVKPGQSDEVSLNGIELAAEFKSFSDAVLVELEAAVKKAKSET